jgi:phage terminase large subunit-like protein
VKIATDPYNAHHLQQQLQAEGLCVLGFSQTHSSLNHPTKLLDTLIAQGRLRTGDNPILNNHASNCVLRTNSEGYIKIQKPAPMSSARVDGMAALTMAIALAADASAGSRRPDPEIIVL